MHTFFPDILYSHIKDINDRIRTECKAAILCSKKRTISSLRLSHSETGSAFFIFLLLLLPLVHPHPRVSQLAISQALRS